MKRGNVFAAMCLLGTILASAAPGHALGPERSFKAGTIGGSRDRIVVATEDDIFVGDPGTRDEAGEVQRWRRMGTGAKQTWDDVQYLRTGNPGNGFGSSLAVDGNLLVVGAPATTTYYPEPGAVYVYEIGASLELVAVLQPQDREDAYGFGSSVAIDGGTIVVGSPETRAHDRRVVGVVWVFESVETHVWSQRARLFDPDLGVPDIDEGWGTTVSISGTTIAVGIPRERVTGVGEVGAISILERGSGAFLQKQRIVGTVAGDGVGTAVDLEPGRLLFGIPGRQTAQLRMRDEMTGNFVPWVTFAPNHVTSQGFGKSVDLSGNRAIVGAPDSDRSPIDSGDAYGYRLRGSTWELYFWPASGITPYERMGRSVALAGDHSIVLSWGQDRDNMAYGFMVYTDQDFTAPSLSLLDPPSVTRTAEATVHFDVSDETTPASALRIECALNDGAWSTCSSPKTFTGLLEHRNKLSVRVRDEAGNTTVRKAYVTSDRTLPGARGIASPPPNEFGWNNEPVTVTWTCADRPAPVTKHPGTGIARCPAPTTVSSEGASQTATGIVVDGAGNEATASYTPINIDLTAPTWRIIRPSPNASGWYSQNVPVSYECFDGLSGVLRCPSPEQHTEGVTTSTVGVVDKALNEAILTSTYRVDTTKPTATFVSATPAANANGWHNAATTLAWSCSDALSGAVAASKTMTLSDTWATDPPVSLTCDDVAGNQGSISRKVLIDREAPAVTMAAPKPLVDSHLVGTASDAESRVAHVDVVAIAYGVGQNTTIRAECPELCRRGRWSASTDSLPRGVYLVYAKAVDRAGNVAQSSQHVVFKTG